MSPATRRPSRSSSSRPPAGAAGSRRGRRSSTPRALARRRHRLGLRRPRYLRPLPGHARVSGRSPSTASPSSPGPPLRRSAELETAYREEKGLAAGPPPVVHRAPSAATSSSTSRPRARSIARSSARASSVRDFTVDPVVRLHYVEVVPPELASPSGDLSRLFEALEREWQLTDLEADLEVVRALQPALEAGKYRVTVAVHEGRQVIAVWPGLHDKAYGVAIDVGSTTIAGHLADLADGSILASNGVMNPQIRFGEDLMSRVSYAMMHAEGAGEMTAAVRKALDGLIATLAMRAGIKRADILELAIVGQPDHASPRARHRPDAARRCAVRPGHGPGRQDDHRASSGCGPTPAPASTCCPASPATSGPTRPAVILAEEPHRAERMTLVVDVGTNAEIVLGDKRRLLAASSPTGPAFEGAQISGGQRAAPGAIERVRIDRDTLEPRIPGHRRRTSGPMSRASPEAVGDDRASPGSAAPASSRSSPSCSSPASSPRTAWSTGRSRRGRRGSSPTAAPRATSSTRRSPGRPARGHHPERRARHPARQGRAVRGRPAADGPARIDAVDEIRLAGAFGSQIDPTHAMILGLVPDCDLANVRSAGNAAGTGALIALLSGAARREIEGVVRQVEKIETAVEPRFQEHFVEAMAFPHKTAVVPAPRGGRDPAAEVGASRPARTAGPNDGGAGAVAVGTGARRPVDGRHPATPERRPRRTPGRTTPRPRGARPVPDPDAGAVRGPRRGGPVAHRGERGHRPPGGGARVPGQRRRAAPLPRCRRRRRGRARPLPARAGPLDRPGERAAPVHPVRAQPRAERRDRRHAHGPRAELRLAVRAGPRPRPALRHHRGLPEPGEAHLR